MTSVDIFQDTQAASVRLRADAAFTGEANVTIKLDDGNGNVATQVVRVWSMPIDRVAVTPGQTTRSTCR